MCKHKHIYVSINRCKYRPVFKYVHLYLCILKTMSSPQCLQFQSNPTGSFSVSFFSIFVNSSSYSENLVPWSLPPTRGYPIHPITVTAVAKPKADVCSPTGSEAWRWTAAPTPTGQLPCSAPHNVSWIELGLEGGRRPAFSPGRRSPQLSRELLSGRSALVPYVLHHLQWHLALLSRVAFNVKR